MTDVREQAEPATVATEYGLFINGERRESSSGRRFESLDPYAAEPWATAADGNAADVDAAVDAARAALDGPWGKLTGFGRAALMRLVARANRA